MRSRTRIRSFGAGGRKYADYGPPSATCSAHEQSHQLFGVVDYTFGWGLDLEAGVGFGLTTRLTTGLSS